MKGLRSNMKEIEHDSKFGIPSSYKGVNLSNIPSYHTINELVGQSNVLIGTYGASKHLVNISGNSATTLVNDIKGYQNYQSSNFIWVDVDKSVSRGGPRRGGPIGSKESGSDRGASKTDNGRIRCTSGGLLIHLPTEKYVKVNSPPEEIDGGNLFRGDSNVFEWTGSRFEKKKIASDKEDSDIEYEEEEIYGGQETMKTPTTDMRELEHVEWDLYLGKIEEKVPYIRSKEEAREWILGEIDPTPPGKDMRMVLDTHMDKDEYERITEMAEEH